MILTTFHYPITYDCSQTSQTLLRRRLIFFHHHHPPHTTLTAFFIGSPQSPSHIWYLGNPHCGFLLLLSIVWIDAAEAQLTRNQLVTLHPKHVMSEFGFTLCKANFDELKASQNDSVRQAWVAHRGTMNEKKWDQRTLRILLRVNTSYEHESTLNSLSTFILFKYTLSTRKIK